MTRKDLQTRLPIACERARPAHRPLLRGWLHALTAAVVWWLVTMPGANLLAPAFSAWPLLVFVLGMGLLYTTSALLHLGRWPQAVHRRLRQMDHANIFLFIGATYTPIYCATLHRGLCLAMLVLTWTLVIVCALRTFVYPPLSRRQRTLLCLLVGGCPVPVLPAIGAALGPQSLLVMLTAGILYTAGALIYWLKRPDPIPMVFGFHELFHFLVVLGNLTVALLIWDKLPQSLPL